METSYKFIDLDDKWRDANDHYLMDTKDSIFYNIKVSLDVIINIAEQYRKIVVSDAIKFSRQMDKEIVADQKVLGDKINKLKAYNSVDIVPVLGQERYKYSNIFYNTIPKEKVLQNQLKEAKEIRDLILNLKFSDQFRRDEISKRYSDLKLKIYNGRYYSEIRGEILNLPKYSFIRSEDYATEIFNAFRSGGKVVVEPISAKEIRDIAYRFSFYKSLCREIGDKVSDYDAYFNLMIEMYTDMNNRVIDDTSHSEETQLIYNRYLKMKVEQTKLINRLFFSVFLAKLDAIYMSYIQDRAILKEAYKNLVGGI